MYRSSGYVRLVPKGGRSAWSATSSDFRVKGSRAKSSQERRSSADRIPAAVHFSLTNRLAGNTSRASAASRSRWRARRRSRGSVSIAWSKYGTSVAMGMSVVVIRARRIVVRGDRVVAPGDVLERVHVNRHVGEMGNLVKEGVPDLLRDPVSLDHSQRALHADRRFGVEAVPEPAAAHIVHVSRALNPFRHPRDVGQQVRVDGVHESRKDVSAYVDEDSDDPNANEQARKRIGERETEGHAGKTGEGRQGRQRVDPRVLPVGDESRTADLPPNPESDACHGLVAERADDCRRHGNGYMGGSDWSEETRGDLIAGPDRAREDHEEDRQPRAVFGSMVAV